jgi:hypothetical protein
MPAKNRGIKRAAHDDGHPVKKARVDSKVGAVLEAIDLSQNMPQSCKNMLAAMVPEAFTVPADERHSYQTMFVDIVGECLRKTEGNMKSAISKEQENASALFSKRETLVKSIEGAEKIHCDKKTVMERQKSTLAELFRTVLENRVALSKAQQDLEVAAAPVAELNKEVEACHSAVQDLVTLRGEVETEAAEAILSKLTALSTHLGIEETLAVSLPTACTKKPSDRGPFDVMVLEQFEKEVTGKAAGFTTQIKSLEGNVKALEVQVEAAKTKLEETTSAHHSASSLLTQAMDEEKSTLAAHSACQAELAAFEPQFKAATEALEENEASLVNFQQWNIGSFDLLKVKAKPVVTEPPKPVLPDVEAEVPSADATLPTEVAVV